MLGPRDIKISDNFFLFLNCSELAHVSSLLFISLPFADDFNLITRDIRKHKKLMARIHELTTSMGLKLKPRKCRSLSVKAGRSHEIEFSLGDATISSILHD